MNEWLLDSSINPRCENWGPERFDLPKSRKQEIEILTPKRVCFKDNAVVAVSYYACLKHLCFNNASSVPLSAFDQTWLLESNSESLFF